jgi:hypothetical protein
VYILSPVQSLPLYIKDRFQICRNMSGVNTCYSHLLKITFLYEQLEL